jgi:hypothetical protein
MEASMDHNCGKVFRYRRVLPFGLAGIGACAAIAYASAVVSSAPVGLATHRVSADQQSVTSSAPAAVPVLGQVPVGTLPVVGGPQPAVPGVASVPALPTNQAAPALPAAPSLPAATGSGVPATALGGLPVPNLANLPLTFQNPTGAVAGAAHQPASAPLMPGVPALPAVPAGTGNVAGTSVPALTNGLPLALP